MKTFNVWRAFRFAFLFLASLTLSSCAYMTDVGYYSHIIGGELSILAKRTPIQKVLADKTVPEKTKQQLRLVNKMRDFAVRELDLPNTDSYTTFVITGREFPRWALAATPEFSRTPITWCFPIYGCATSLPFFDKTSALQYQQKLRREGYDVFLRGVPAYSTNGWFSDPVFDTFLAMPDHVIAGLIFHEKAHEKLSIKNDSAFNESFASFVQEIGEALWIERMHGPEYISKLLEQRSRGSEIDSLLSETARELDLLYQKKITQKEMRKEKEHILSGIQEKYKILKQKWNGFSGYDGWMNREWNNARLNQNNEYVAFVPVFRTLYQDCGQNLDCFYQKSAELGALPKTKRTAEIKRILGKKNP